MVMRKEKNKILYSLDVGVYVAGKVISLLFLRNC
jgi:hypothetical protein